MRRTVRRGSPSSAHRCRAGPVRQSFAVRLRSRRAGLSCTVAWLFARLARCLLASLLLPSGNARVRAHTACARAWDCAVEGRVCVGRTQQETIESHARNESKMSEQSVRVMLRRRTKVRPSPPPPPRPCGWCMQSGLVLMYHTAALHRVPAPRKATAACARASLSSLLPGTAVRLCSRQLRAVACTGAWQSQEMSFLFQTLDDDSVTPPRYPPRACAADAVRFARLCAALAFRRHPKFY